MKAAFAIISAALLAGAEAQVVLTSEHVDLSINFNSAALAQPGGPWRVTLRDEDNQIEHLGQRSGTSDPLRVVLAAGINGRVSVPSDPRYSFLGPVGADVWVLPQSQDNELPFVGISLENKSSDPGWQGDGVAGGFLARGVSIGLFQNNRITLRLESFSGPGNFFLYFTDSFGEPAIHFNTADGLSVADSRAFSPANHVHFNWAFTAPGEYLIGLRASGTLVPANTFTQSEITTFRFVVVPEPTAVCLIAVAAAFFGMRRRKISPAILVATVSWPLACDAYTTVTDEHTDLQIRFVDGAFAGRVRSDSQPSGVPRDETLLFDGPVGTTKVARPAGATWDFLGMAAGEPLYYWPQSLLPARQYLGFGSDHGAVPPGTFASYFESDPRVNATAAWIKIALTGFRYEPAPGVTGTPQFSLWQTGSFGPPKVWMSTADGGITSADATWLLEGGHGHFNWGFSQPGYYQLDFQFSGYLASTGALLASTAQTYHFGVEFLPLAIPTDVAARGPESILADRPAVDFRINSPGTTGPIRLAAAETTIHSLLQNSTTSALVETAGKTLRTGSLSIASGKANLTLGAQAGDGTVAAAGDLLIAVEEASAKLTINAAIDAPVLHKSGPGALELRGSVGSATIHADGGRTTISSSAALAALHIGPSAEVLLDVATPALGPAPVPEPGSIALFLAGAAALALRRG